MTTRTARLIRAGILAARDPELAPYAHLGHPVVWEACRRELKNIEWRAWLAVLEEDLDQESA